MKKMVHLDISPYGYISACTKFCYQIRYNQNGGYFMKKMVHLETLSTRVYYDKTPAEIMSLVDQEINIYLWDTSYELINVVEYGFNPTKKGNGARGYARIAVYIPTNEPDEEEVDMNDGHFHSNIKI